MSADAPIVSRPYHAKMCCERCVFKTGLHREDCPERWQFVEGSGTDATVIDWNLWIEALKPKE